MARHSQPREIAELKGAVAKNPQRYGKSVPKSAMPLGEAPASMTDEQKSAWFEIDAMIVDGVATYADRILMDLLATYYAQYLEDRDSFSPTKARDMVGLCARFGMSPSDRQKLSIGKDDNDEGEFGTL